MKAKASARIRKLEIQNLGSVRLPKSFLVGHQLPDWLSCAAPRTPSMICLISAISQRPLELVLNQLVTIEIGLVVIGLETLEIVDEFQRLVRPQIHPIPTVFCKKLTSIQQVEVNSAGTYLEVG